MKIKKEEKRLFIGQIMWLIKATYWFKNLITRLITTLFKVFGSLIEPYNRQETFFLLYNFEKEGSRF